MKKIISSILSVMMIISAFTVLGTTASAEDAIEIWNIEDLYNVRYDLNANYILMADIDMTEYVANGGDYCFLDTNGWNPIGSNGAYGYTKFTGVFDGNNHTITGLRIDVATLPSGYGTMYCGLFAYNSGTIKNLSIEDISIYNIRYLEARKYIGAVSASNSGTISNCHILSGKINSFAYKSFSTVGGITGENTGTVTKSSNNSTICGSSYNNSSSSLRSLYLGGLVGYNSNMVSLSFNSGKVQDYTSEYNRCVNIYQGGLVGYNYGTSSVKAEITDCYNAGDVYNTTGDWVSGYVYAFAYQGYSTIKNCYNTGSAYFGTTLKDFSNADVTNCYYLNGKNVSTTGTTALSELQMTKEINFADFDFSNNWVVDSSTTYKFPQLKANRQDTSKEIDTIEFKNKPSKVNYRTGDKIVVDGAITVYYMDGTFEDIDITEKMLSGYDMSTPGTQTVSVTYRGNIVTYDITVIQRPKAVGVSLVSGPAKTEFVRDTALDYSGAVARIFYDDGTTENISLTASNTTGADIKKSGTYIVTYTYEDYSVNFTVKVVPLKITGIEIKSLPKKTTYIEGQSIDTDGLDVGLTRNDGSSESVKGYAVDYENKAGTQTVTVTYNGYTTTFDVEFTPRTLISISATHQPDKTQYFSDEKFDKTGLVVTATYNNGVTDEITDYTTSEITDEIGTQVIEISYKGKTTFIAIEVIERSVEYISVTKAPLKSAYVIGSEFDTSGMEVTAFYNDGTSKVVEDYFVSSLPSTTGAGTVTISYKGKTATVEVSMKEKKLVRLEVAPPQKTVYFTGEELDTTSMVVRAVFDNGKSELLSDYQISGFGDTTERNIVTVTYQSKSVDFEVYIHNLTGKWITSKEETCGAEGEKVMYCTVCGEIVKTEKITALAHNYKSKEVNPTCTERGYTEYECEICHDTYRDNFVNETGHNPVTDHGKLATCQENGLTDGSHCNICNTVLVPQETIAKLNHSYTAQLTSVATCTEKGSITYTCQSCGDSYVTYQDELKHNFTVTKTVDSTCTTAGYKEYTCSNCSEKYSEQIALKAHSPVVDSSKDATCTSTGITAGSHCSECGYIISSQSEIKAKGHSYTEKVVAPSCKDKGYTVHTCTTCNDSYIDNYTDLAEHTYVDTITTPATCHSTGIKTSTCSVCGDKYTTVIEMTEHRVVTDSAVAPSCTKSGLTAGSHCSECNSIIVPQTSVVSPGHDYSKTVVEPTCTDIGYTIYMCNVCGDSYKSDLKSTTEHIYSKKVVKPTCSAKGYTLNICELCGESFKSNYVDTVEHSYKSVVTKQPTCTEKGAKKYTCVVCGDTYNESIDMLEHTEVVDSAVAPTPVSNGLTEGKHCSECGTVLVPQETIAKLITAVTLEKSSVNLYVKGTSTIKATVNNSYGTTTYMSSSNIVRVDSNGKVTALKAGTAKITVTNNKVSKIFTVKVVNPKLNKTSVTLKKGKTFTIKITGKIGSATFTSSNKNIVTVSKSGKIVAKKKGSATITVKTNGITLKCKVKVK